MALELFTFRLAQSDIDQLATIAKKQGIPERTFARHIIHQYLESQSKTVPFPKKNLPPAA
ncbi:hypothetical protein C7B61_00310 [filamentous cyanobacterium CCP1]|nr:hypothetical protein C7B76_16750 [filamentous cyanobacterium CCP2]PSB68541.1 hypothetical protein C7B61_00310 [filamentous cyanobacterium CCP1]